MDNRQKIFFLTSAGHSIGYGHLNRCLSLAKEFHKRKQKVTFIFFNSQESAVESGIEVICTGGMRLIKEIRRISKLFDFKNAVCIVDLKRITYNQLSSLKQYFFLIVDINGEYKGKNPSDIIVRGSIGEKSSGNLLGGLKYKLLGHNFFPQKNKKCLKKTVIMTFGGSDPADISGIVSRSIHNDGIFDFKLIVGDGYKRKAALAKAGPQILFNIKNLGRYFPDAHAAIVSYGITLYEALFCGTPCLVVPQNKPQEKEAAALVRMGLISMAKKENLKAEIFKFIRNDKLLGVLRNKIKGRIDLDAPKRIADCIEKKKKKEEMHAK